MSSREKKITKPYIIFVVLLFLSMIFPVYGIANRVFPLMLGLPFGLFWIVLMEVIAFLVLCGFYRYEYGNKDKGDRS